MIYLLNHLYNFFIDCLLDFIVSTYQMIILMLFQKNICKNKDNDNNTPLTFRQICSSIGIQLEDNNIIESNMNTNSSSSASSSTVPLERKHQTLGKRPFPNIFFYKISHAYSYLFGSFVYFR